MSNDYHLAPLVDSITILVVDDDVAQLEFYKDMIASHPFYVVYGAESAKEAEVVIARQRPHLCLLDLGIDDINSDEFYLLKKYGTKMPVIIVSGSADMERAFIASKIGAAGMIAKPPDMTTLLFWKTLSGVFLERVILPCIAAYTNPVLGECCRVLNEKLPETVTQWASQANITEAYLRRVWSECYSFSPKQVLFMYTYYTYAFDLYNEMHLADINETRPVVNKKKAETVRKMSHYYVQNRRILDMMIKRPLALFERQ